MSTQFGDMEYLRGSSILVTGGAGYIGSHVCKLLAAAGYVPVTFDNLSTGRAEAVRFGPLVEADLLDRAALDTAFADHAPVAVMHFAADSAPGDARQDQNSYWRANVTAMQVLIEAAMAAGCMQFIFASSCAVYGEHNDKLISEDTEQRPVNAYGESKRAGEALLHEFGASHGLNSVMFRCFNVAGADPDTEVGECHHPETHLVPLILEAIDGRRSRIEIFGNDYDTPDGTCVRDYVHVMDVAAAHVLGLQWLAAGRGSQIFNLGGGRGFSVREVIDRCQAVTGKTVPCRPASRRAGDAARLVADNRHAVQMLGWKLRHSSLDRMIADAWQWYRHGGSVR